MEIPMYQTTWHGIDLMQFPAARNAQKSPASPEFFAQFYAALESGQGRIDADWAEHKRRLGETVSLDLIKVWQERTGRKPRILALAVGKGIVEGVWAENGYEVTFNECQDSSLKGLRQRFPQAGFLVGDARSLNPPQRYDLITLIGLDYCMNRAQLGAFLGKVAGWLEPDGQIILCCMNFLSYRRLLAIFLKSAGGYYRRVKHVFWGYWRSTGEFFRVAAIASLKVDGVYGFGHKPPNRTTLVPRSSIQRLLWPWKDPNVMFLFSKK
jgi:SAM-dependent methyltransferase